jgi:GNAT superfamily N-acetyltransferase
MNYSQNNLEQLFKLIGTIPNQEYSCELHYDYVKAKHSIWPNQLINLKATETDLDCILDSIEKRSKIGTIPNILMLKPTPLDYQAATMLQKRGYKPGTWTAMSHDLNLPTLQSSNSTLQVKLVESNSELRLWQAIVETELMGNHALDYELLKHLLQNKNCYFFLGFEKSKPVTTSFLFVNNTDAGIYLVSTLKTHRKKGYGKEITLQCLVKAKAENCKQVAIQATELGLPVYQSLGFSDQGLIHVFRIQSL